MSRFPQFPWDSLADCAAQARRHPDGLVDLSVGTPVDPTPMAVQEALFASANSPGYPTTAGLPELAASIRRWLRRRAKVEVEVGVLPTIGSKEMVAWLPSGLGLGESDVVVIPRIAYPTYAVGAQAVGADIVATDDIESVQQASLIWLNSPSNPTGSVASVQRLREIVAWARSRQIVVVSDECYLDFGWEAEPVSVLDPQVNDSDVTGLLAVHSLSKRSSMAGYRCGFLAGDPQIVHELLAMRKHLGFMVPGPVQRAAVIAYDDQEHVDAQRIRYAQRRSILIPRLQAAGFRIDNSEAGLYLWATRDEDSWATTRWFADRGILVAPGTFYGDEVHVRVALTATDERVLAAAARLDAAPSSRS